MGSIFKFKKFSVDQSGCAMRINTDGVLLAAVAEQVNPSQILDIGTGTGVIALMMAQRFPAAAVDAVEIDESASLTARANFEASDFASRSAVYHTAIEDFSIDKSYDLIISNPPYFVNDLKNPEKRKEIARHADEQFFEALLSKVANLLSAKGLFWVILPVKQAEMLAVKATDLNLSVQKQIDICSDGSKPVIRHVLCISRSSAFTDQTKQHDTFYIYESQGIYTPAYRLLLKDFFLAF